MNEIKSNLMATALTIAGSDPSGGAGAQADLKTFQQMGVFGMSAITLLTVQNTQGVSRVQMVDEQLVEEQIEAVMVDIPPSTIKLGALGTSAMVRAVSGKLQRAEVPIVVDPVMVSKHGHALVAGEFVDCFKEQILPLATIVTPNRFEAERLVGFPIRSRQDARRATEQLHGQYGCASLIKLGPQAAEFENVLFDGLNLYDFCRPLLESKNTHGTGCVLSALIAAKLAIGETSLPEIVEFAIDALAASLRSPTGLGRGIHPIETRLLKRN